MTDIVLNIRDQFPILHQKVHGHPLIYFDNAATSQKPLKVINAISEYYLQENSNIHRGAHYLSNQATEKYEKSREAVRRLINAESTEEIILTKGTTESINLVASCLSQYLFQPGDEILISGLEHHANIVPWHLLGGRVGSKTVAAPVDADGSFNMEQFKAHITPRTKIISVPHVSNVLGTVFPIAEIAALAHENGAICIVDGCQGVTHLPVDVTDLGCDFYVFSGHKLYGPSGIGVCWGRSEIWAGLPPFLGGGDMIDDVKTDRSTYAEPPLRFEAGTPPIVECIGLGAAVDFVQQIGMANLRDHEMDMLRYGHQRLASVQGLNFIGMAADKSGVISFTLDAAHPHDISTLIDQDGVAIRAGHHCAQPLMKFYGLSSTARASVGVYTQESDFDVLAEALEKVNRIFG